MAAGDYNLGVVVSAVDNVTRPMRRIMRGVSGTVNSAGRTLMRFSTRVVAGVGRALMRMARMAALAGAAISEELVRRSINAFASYEQAVVNALSVTGLMGKAFEKAKGTLTEFGLALSVQSNKMVTEIAGAFYALASAGLNLNQVMTASRGVLALAEGTLAEMGLTTELTTSMMKAFQLPATAMNRIVNALAATIGASRMNMERLAAAIPYAATTAQQFKISLEGMLAALAMAVDRGLEATMAGTQFRMMLTQSTKVTKEGAAALKKYGISAAAVNIAQRGMVPVLKVLQRAQVKYSDLVKIFGLRAATMAAVLKDNVAEFVDLAKRVTGTNRAFQMQRQQLNSVQGQWRAFKGDVQKLQVEFAQRMEPQLRRIISRLREFVQGLSARGTVKAFADSIGELVDKAQDFLDSAAFEDWVGKVKAAIGGLGDWLKGEGLFPKDAIRIALEPAEGAVKNFVGVVIGEFHRLMADAVPNWDKIREAVKKWGQSFGEVGATIITSVAALLPTFAKLLSWVAGLAQSHPGITAWAAAIGAAFAWLYRPIEALAKGIAWVGAKFLSVAKWIAGIVVPALVVLVNIVKAAQVGLKNFFTADVLLGTSKFGELLTTRILPALSKVLGIAGLIAMAFQEAWGIVEDVKGLIGMARGEVGPRYPKPRRLPRAVPMPFPSFQASMPAARAAPPVASARVPAAGRYRWPEGIGGAGAGAGAGAAFTGGWAAGPGRPREHITVIVNIDGAEAAQKETAYEVTSEVLGAGAY